MATAVWPLKNGPKASTKKHPDRFCTFRLFSLVVDRFCTLPPFVFALLALSVGRVGPKGVPGKGTGKKTLKTP